MSNELFDVAPSLSPKLRWMEKHEVKTSFREGDCAAWEWVAWNGKLSECDHIRKIGPDLMGWGETEDDALFDLAKVHDWPMWHEEARG